MDHKPLYERYRPQRFEDFVGQPDVTRALRAMIQTGRLTGAALIHGPTGSGKTTLARITSRALGVDRFWDHHEIDAGECKIDTVRQFKLTVPAVADIADRLRQVGRAEGLNGRVDYAGLAARSERSHRQGLQLLEQEIAVHVAATTSAAL